MIHQAKVSSNAGNHKPAHRARSSSSNADVHLSRCVIVEVDSALRNCRCTRERQHREPQTLPHRCWEMRIGGVWMVVGIMSQEDEEGQEGREEGHELGVGGGHAVAFS